MNIKYLLLTLLFTMSSAGMYAQKNKRPKLIIGIIVDQMRNEYLYRFQDNFSEGGFKRIMKNGFEIKNMHYNYIPTVTGAGHSSVYTGTTPAVHGIVSNNWYDRASKKNIYCVQDDNVRLVDENISDEINDYSRSPKNQLSSTITDELKLFYCGRSKVIGISLKDRGAILPAGHMADYAFWINKHNGHFVTSSYYTKKLPPWLDSFNKRKLTDSLLNLTWDTLLPAKKYTHSEKDDAPNEKVYKGLKKSVLPYNFKDIRENNGNFSLIKDSPFGNTLVTQMSKAAIDGEKLGEDDTTDFLTISYSSTDRIGHNFGIRSKEIEDTYVRLDREIEELIKYLDKKIGEENYTLFLTADHGAGDTHYFLKQLGIRSGFYKTEKIKETLNDCLSKKLGRKEGDYVAWAKGKFIYLRQDDKEQALKYVRGCLKCIDGLKRVFIPSMNTPLENDIDGNFVKNFYHPKISSDIYLLFDPGWMEFREYGTSHENSYSSDTHVPMLWYGWGIPKGKSSVKPHYITEVAATLSMLLNIPLPNGAGHQVIDEIFE